MAAAHILIYPYPELGHIIPLLDLTTRLLSRGLTVTLLVTTSNRALLDPLLSSYSLPQFNHLILPDPSLHNNPSQIRLISHMLSIQQQHYPFLLNWFRAHPSPPVAIISDFFLGWTKNFAQEIGIKRVVFSPSGAFFSCISASMWRDLPQNDNVEDMDFLVKFPKVPNCPSYPWWQISYIYRMAKAGDPDWDFYRECMVANAASWGIVFNTFTELERVYLDDVKQRYGKDRVWAMGPVLPAQDGLIDRGGSSSVLCHEVLTWLDSHVDKSIIYVCFGSRTSLTWEQMDELAGALEKSEIYFVWVVRQPDKRHMSNDHGVLPKGFEDRVAGRGFVIKGWAPQVEILRHRAVVAFVTHCGWNSVLEGIAAGVVMLTWPMSADQFANAGLLVDQLGVGIRVGEATRKIPKSGELAKILAKSMEETRVERMNAKRLQEAALSAINGGSSDENLNEFVRRLNELNKKENVATERV